MDSSRDDILANIRRSLGVTGREAPRLAAVADRLASTPQGVLPARGQLDFEGRIALFKEQAESVQASVAMVEKSADAAAEIARYLRDNNLPATIRFGADSRLAALDWAATMLAVSRGASEGDDLNAVTHAFASVAETGTLALVSGADNPTTLNFLPDNHFVVARARDIVPDYESVWVKLRAAYGNGAMPRTVNFITGPSRSADIEQKLLLGAHGPRRLHIVITRD